MVLRYNILRYVLLRYDVLRYIMLRFFSNIRRKDRWDIDGSLNTSAIYIVAECRHIFISVISPSDSKCAGRDTYFVVMKDGHCRGSARLFAPAIGSVVRLTRCWRQPMVRLLPRFMLVPVVRLPLRLGMCPDESHGSYPPL